MSDPSASDIYSREGMEALVKERALLKLERDVAKREELRAKFKIQRELIEKRMKSEPVTGAPFPEDCVDKLMSNEVLEMILLRLQDPVDVISAYNTCGTFQQILETKRKTVLLPKVLKIFFDQKMGFKPKTALREILSLRLVSKSWRNVVDKYLFGEEENTGYQWYFKQKFQGRERNLAFCRMLTIDLTTEINRAISVLSNMSDSDRKLFAGRVRVVGNFHVRVRVDSFAVNEFYARVSEFLEHFGNSVWKVDLTLWKLSAVNGYDSLRYWAALMPGLQYLEVVMKVPDNEAEFVRRVRQLPFPSLPLLRELHCNQYRWYNLCQSTFLAIIRANPWIQQTSLSFSDEQYCGVWGNRGDIPEEEFYHPNGLKLIRDLPESFKPVSMKMTGLPKMAPASWPLKELDLALYELENYGRHVCIERLFSCLEAFKETLTHLTIYSNFHHVHREWPYLNLPNLKTLNMSLNNKNPSVDFLLPMKSLENLALICHVLFNGYINDPIRWTMFHMDKTELIKFKGLLRHMEASNIAKVFPLLKKMEIQGDGASDRVHYFREADVMKLDKKDEKILIEIQADVNEG